MKTTLEDFQNILGKVSYRFSEDWKIEVHGVERTPYGKASHAAFYLQVVFFGKDARSGGSRVEQRCRKWQLSPYMTDTEVVVTAFKAVLAAEEHECREKFKYKDQPIFSPHLDVNCLARWVDTMYLELDERPENQK